ncbi:MAG: Hpt domain-containing protein [Acidimicrobiales bacterium]
MAQDGAPQGDGTGAAGGTHGRPPAVDRAVIEQLAGITDAQGVSVLGELLDAFLTAVPCRLDTLDRAAAAADFGAVADQAHALTGSAASFGAREMADLCRALGTAAQAGDHEATTRLVDALHGEFLQIRAWLVTYRGRT